MFKALFQRFAPQVNLSVFDVTQGQYPKNINDCDAYITSGSAASVYDNEPWISIFETYLKQLDQVKKKTVGICFGHQMMAQALGAKVQKSVKGWGIGSKKYQVLREKDWMQPPLENYTILVSHQDQVTCLPAQAQLLASNAHCRIFMFQVEEHFLGIQGHPEFTPEYALALMNYRAKIIPKPCIDAARATVSEELNIEALVNWIITFIQSK